MGKAQNPTDVYRRQQQKREAKKNKEVRQKMREVAVLHRNTFKMQLAISRYRDIPKTRKMTAVEKEKLSSMEKELEETLARQKEAGIDPKKWETQDNSTGYDPLAAAEAASDDSEQSDNDGVYGSRVVSMIHGTTGDDDLGIQTVSYFAEPEVRDLQKELRSFVPAAIARKQKQKERQQVIASVPSVPKMSVNAAPDVDVGPTTSAPVPQPGGTLRNTIKPVAGVQFKSASVKQVSKPKDVSKNSSLDDEYQKFMSEMGEFL
ncbi:hypothetical protein FBU59_001711 [Linderina macrospora]|uniref:Uncharacterized protein n=1 Tax=Linderina macrospora TaxID=4868 RepID=A0ACC1JD29_9FUNG|nr:hypothetical protein FBU59_001711 [Linderina macrospora]